MKTNKRKTTKTKKTKIFTKTKPKTYPRATRPREAAKIMAFSSLEAIIISEFLWDSPYGTPQTSPLSRQIGSEDFLTGLCSLRGVDCKALVSKIDAAPNSLLNKMCADFREAWRFHQNDFLEFFGRQSYSFAACEKTDAEEVWVPGGELADGSIVVDRIPSYVNKADVGSVLLALRKVYPDGRNFIEEEISFPDEIGVSHCVETTGRDQIIFAQRKGRKGLTRFVKDRAPEPTNSVFVVLKKDSKHRYVLITGFVGARPEPEPWDEKAFAHSKNPQEAKSRSIEFWKRHALVYSPDLIVPGSETDHPQVA